jgi:hypothetical protein
MKDSKMLRRGNSHPGSIKKALKFSKRLLAKRGIIVESDREEDEEMTPPVSENRLEDSGKDNTLKDKHVPAGSISSQVLMNIVHYCLQCVISLHYWNSLIRSSLQNAFIWRIITSVRLAVINPGSKYSSEILFLLSFYTHYPPVHAQRMTLKWRFGIRTGTSRCVRGHLRS